MTGLIRLHIAMAALCLALSIAVPTYYHEVVPYPPLLQDNPEFRRNVDSTKDLEQLRSMLYTVAVGTDDAVVASKEVTDAAVKLLASVAGLIAAVFAASAFWLWRLRRRNEGQTRAS